MIEALIESSGDSRSGFSHPMIYWVAAYIRLTLELSYHQKRAQSQSNFSTILGKLAA